MRLKKHLLETVFSVSVCVCATLYRSDISVWVRDVGGKVIVFLEHKFYELTLKDYNTFYLNLLHVSVSVQQNLSDVYTSMLAGQQRNLLES